MSDAWAIVLPASEQRAIASLRLLPRVSVLVEGDGVWVRGDALDEDRSGSHEPRVQVKAQTDRRGFHEPCVQVKAQTIRSLLLSLPCRDRFLIRDGNTLFRPDERTPSGILPDGNWVPIGDWIAVELPAARVARARIPRIPLRLVQTTAQPEPGDLLITGRDVWERWGANASQVRLDRLSFAASDDGRILVRGRPLPSVPGEQFIERDGIAVSAGWTWSPDVTPEAIRRAARIDDDTLLVLHLDGSHEVIPACVFVPARRSAIRQLQRLV